MTLGNVFPWLGLLVAVAVVAMGIGTHVSSGSPKRRNAVTFAMAAAGSFCASMVIDFWAQVVHGEIPITNVALPSITWFALGLALISGAFMARGSIYAIALPFALNALLALAVSGTHRQNLLVGLLLLLLGLLVAVLRHCTGARKRAPFDTGDKG